MNSATAELRQSVYHALETYSNVHRGSGHFSMTTTRLYEEARQIVLDYLDADPTGNQVIFCTPRRLEQLIKNLNNNLYQVLTSKEFGLALGVCALVIRKTRLSKYLVTDTGGGTARLMASNWVIWSESPARLEAGTPAVIQVICFAKALQLIRRYGENCFSAEQPGEQILAEANGLTEKDKQSGLNALHDLQSKLIGKNLIVPTEQGAKTFVNLDNSASTPTFEPIWRMYASHLFHSANQKDLISKTRSVLLTFLEAPESDYDVIFTSNTTEAINIVAGCFWKKDEEQIIPVVLNTKADHSSNDLPWRIHAPGGLTSLTVDQQGLVDLKELEKVLMAYNELHQFGQERIRLIAVTGASNVLGTCNQIKAISTLAHQYNAKILVDAAQLIAHRPIQLSDWDVDYLAFSAHKIYAPFGSGALILRKGLFTCTSEDMVSVRSSGEQNLAGIAALGKALTLLQEIGMNTVADEETRLAGLALQWLRQVKGIKLHGMPVDDPVVQGGRLGIFAFDLKDKLPNKVSLKLATLEGVGVRSGCHCAHIFVKHMLGIPKALETFQRIILILFKKLSLPGVVRISLGIENSESDIERLVLALQQIADNQNKIRSDRGILNDFARMRTQLVFGSGQSPAAASSDLS